MCVLRFLHQWGPGHSPSHEGCHTTRARYRDRRCACPSCKDLARNRVNLVRADRYLVDVYTDQQLLAQVVSGNENGLRELYGVGKETAVVLSTHILDGVAHLCDRVAVLRTGTITGPPGESAATSPHRVRGLTGSMPQGPPPQDDRRRPGGPPHVPGRPSPYGGRGRPGGARPPHADDRRRPGPAGPRPRPFPGGGGRCDVARPRRTWPGG